jgi:hypothetical protein
MRKPKAKKAATKEKAKPAKIDRAAVDAKRVLFAVEQLDAMTQRCREHYYAEEFPGDN